ncbi:GH32 C-terminal domain-containing protein [Corynebacterium sp. UBA2622]|uniref:GH32 C-terminal domain-containing protein n=1 Tax=Corynebacterium sp. UBA2622 TaxID=1946393 RepID=UPI0025BC6EE5|nr:GH32 C-terminal domain-containing protein [Corynebacterium sp. UBA2622]
MGIYRPELHFTAERGILQAAAGVLRDGSTSDPSDPTGSGDTWHMFHQYALAPGEPSRWGHAVSDGNPFDWVECNDAIVPAGDETTVRAGAVVASPGGIDLYFTSATEAGSTIQIAHADDLDGDDEDISEEYSASAAFVRRGDAVSDTGGFTSFRSPCVVQGWLSNDDRDRGESGWLMLAVTGPTDAPVVTVLTSEVGADWTVLGALEFDGDPGFDPAGESVVAPRIFRLRDEVDGQIYDVLLLTLERRGPDGGNRDETVYVTGKLDGNEFTVVTPAQVIDHGHDFSRPRTTTYTNGTRERQNRYDRAYLYGSMRRSGRNADLTTEKNWEAAGWAGALTLPRRVTLQHGHLYQTPAPGLPDAVEESRRAKMWTGICEIPVGSSVVAEILDGDGEPAAIVTHSGDTIALDRHDGTPAECGLHDEDEDNITIIVDGSTIEVFAGGGAAVLSSRFWPEGGCSGIRVRSTGDAEIFSEWRRGH